MVDELQVEVIVWGFQESCSEGIHSFGKCESSRPFLVLGSADMQKTQRPPWGVHGAEGRVNVNNW